MNDVNQPHNSDVEQYMFFPTMVYSAMAPQFLNKVSLISEEYLNKVKCQRNIDDVYPCFMSGGYQDDNRLDDFYTFTASIAWNILAGQGYYMDNKNVQFSEVWTQEHHKHSHMEQHVHNNGVQIVGFYFLETPENCSEPAFFDPRPGKNIINLPQINTSQVSYASDNIHFKPLPGMLMFANGWLPHGFSRHMSEKPLKFVHFNLIVTSAAQNCSYNMPEVV